MPARNGSVTHDLSKGEPMAVSRREALALMASAAGAGVLASYAPVAAAAEWDRDEMREAVENTSTSPQEDVPKETLDTIHAAISGADGTDLLIVQAKHNVRNDSEPQEPFVLVHLSDVHGDKDALARIVEWAKAHEGIFDDIIATGDLAALEFSDGLDFWEDVEGAEQILTCVGNHDVYGNLEARRAYDSITVADAAEQYIEPFESSWGDIDHEPGTTWYAKDYPERGVRLIVCDCMVYLGENSNEEAQEQNSWLEETLDDALAQDLTVVLAEHLPLADESMVDCSWATFDRKFAYGPFLPNDIPNRVQDFIDAGGTFACYLCGHCHCDAVHTLPGHPEQFALTVPCLSDAGDQIIWGDMDRSSAATRDAFDIVVVDTANSLVKVVRIGANRDLAMQHRSALTWDYRRHRLVYAG